MNNEKNKNNRVFEKRDIIELETHNEKVKKIGIECIKAFPWVSYWILHLIKYNAHNMNGNQLVSF